MRRVPLLAIIAAAAALAGGCTGTAGSTGAAAPGGTRAPAAAARPAPPFPVAENQKPGTPAWQIGRHTSTAGIEGYADHVSVLPGQSLRLFVSTAAARYRVDAFRMGWYGGNQARLVWESRFSPGRVQAAAQFTASTRTVTAPWQPSMTVRTAGWPAGDYLLRLDASSGAEHFVPITVRSASTAGKVVLLNGVTTWQAYNLWGGYDLYSGPGGFADRSYAVSFDRPYTLNGANMFLYFDQPAVAIAERSGVPLAYETDVDINQNPGLLGGARAVISLGHDEYYSQAMRTALTSARSAGTNIAFLGANAIYRHIRFGSTALGPDRLVICYKDAGLDPMGTVNQSLTTQDWRDPPDPRPESVITGDFYECNPVSDPYVVYAPSSWIFAGTGVRRGTSFPNLVGVEYDRVNPSVPFPRPLQVIAHSPVACGGAASYADTSYYTVPSGAGVIDVGTMRWVCALTDTCGQGVTPAARDFTDVATANILRVFAAGPAGRVHPAQDNLAGLHLAKGSAYDSAGAAVSR
jgi:hypothetical protein